MKITYDKEVDAMFIEFQEGYLHPPFVTVSSTIFPE